MKVGLSCSVIQGGRTGVAQYVFSLVQSFATRARQHEFVLFILEADLPLFAFAGGKFKIVPVPERFRAPLKNILWHQTKLPKLARHHQLDVLHVPSYRRLLWPRPCALVATIHDLAPFRLARKYEWKRMLYARAVVPGLARRQEHIIAISENTARDVKTCLGLPDHKITVIHNGLDHDRFFPSCRKSAQAATAIKHGLRQPFFLYLARLEHPAKNHVRLIQAFNQFKAATGSPWQLVFGGADWHGAEAIHSAIQASPHARDIRSLGFLNQEDLPDLYRAAEVFVYPSLYEGFGLPPLEAMACGCPVICSRRGSLPEVVGEAAVLVEPENPDSLAGQLRALEHNSELRKSLRSAGVRQAQRFNWQKTAEATLKVYQSAAKSHGSRRIRNR